MARKYLGIAQSATTHLMNRTDADARYLLLNNIIGKEMAYVEVDRAQTGFDSSYADITDATVTFTAVASRKYYVLADAQVQKSATAGYGVLVLYQGATQLAITAVSFGASEYGVLSINRRLTFSAGSVTLKLTMGASVGTIDTIGNVPIAILSVVDAGT